MFAASRAGSWASRVRAELAGRDDVMLRIDYTSEDFSPASGVTNGSGVLTTSWDDLLWAAVTVGRPNRQYVFRHGTASIYEALFRLSLVRMALEQAGPRAYRLRRTTAAKTLDPSEKGAVNYFLGLAICKLFADKLLGAPWMLHLDVFRPQLNPVLTGRSRPDLVGQTLAGDWIALECKGRVSVPSAEAKNKAKEQAERLVSVNGAVPTVNVGGIAYFRGDTLEFFWRDPTPEPLRVKKPIELQVEPVAWSYYYRPILDLIRSRPNQLRLMSEENVMMPVEDLDLEIGVNPAVLRAVAREQWAEARRVLPPVEGAIGAERYHADGIRVVAGPSWALPFKDEGAEAL